MKEMCLAIGMGLVVAGAATGTVGSKRATLADVVMCIEIVGGCICVVLSLLDH